MVKTEKIMEQFHPKISIKQWLCKGFEQLSTKHNRFTLKMVNRPDFVHKNLEWQTTCAVFHSQNN